MHRPTSGADYPANHSRLNHTRQPDLLNNTMPTTSPTSALQIDASTLVTSLGDDLLTNISAFTSLRKNFRYHEIEGEKILTAPARDIAGNLQELQRLNALLQAAWLPMIEKLKNRQPLPTLYLFALPQWLSAEQLRSMIDAFSAQCRQQGLHIAAMQTICGGAESCHTALTQAFAWLAKEPALKQVVLLTVDSLCEPDVLLRDLRAKRIYGREQSSGWVPGEAAACLLLTAPSTKISASSQGLILYPPGTSSEPATSPRWPSDIQGDGAILEQAIQTALKVAELKPQNISHHVSDSDGSRWRFEDEHFAIPRLLSRFSSQDQVHWKPDTFQAAELVGQVGAAWGALNWALINGLLQHELITFDRALCTSQDISGRCSANVLAVVTHE
jgi:hypothetical protein